MREVPHKGAAQTVQHGMEAFAKIDPPHGEENDEAGAQGQPQLATPGVVLADGGDGSGEREQRFAKNDDRQQAVRSEEHTSELQSLMRISYAVFCLNTKNTTKMA